MAFKIPNRSIRSRPHNFAKVADCALPRSSFNRSFGLKTSLNANYLVPFFIDEVLPGDTFNLKVNGFGRMATPIVPVMDNLYMDTFFFFVPNRLTWTNWERFNGAQDDPDSSTDFVIPYLNNFGTFATGSIGDYFGLPINIDLTDNKISALPFRAYDLIYNEWFRDENLIDSIVVSKGDGPDDMTGYELRKRGKRHDYFTSCLPWPQKGDAVSLPLGTSAPVVSDGTQIQWSAVGGAWTDQNATTTNNAGTIYATINSGAAGGAAMTFGANTALYTDLSSATAATINQLREAFQIQKLYERDARGGTRYTEILRAHFGVTSPDFRLQRPEYLGGGTTFVNVNPIPQTNNAAGLPTPLGNLGAVGTVNIRNHGFTKSFVEHGYVIGLVNVRADLTYSQGINRMWTRQTRFDFYWPALAHIGEQAVLNQEIWAAGNDTTDLEVFGYQGRYDEYRYYPSMITGLMRPDATGTLSYWHLSQDFATLPALNQAFIEEAVPMERVLAVTDEDDFLLDVDFRYHCTRAIPINSIPGYIDHF